MRFMVIVKGCEGCEAGKPRKEFLAEMGRFNEELKKAGVLLALEGLVPPSNATNVKFSGSSRTVTDGPFAESKEMIGGFWLWKCKSKQEALEWVKRIPFQDKEVELREVIDAEEFAESFRREYLASKDAQMGVKK